MQEISVNTTEFVPGKEVSESLGIVVGVGNVAFGPFTASKARGAFAKAIKELGVQLNTLGADAVIGLRVTATSGSLVFFRPHTVVVTGTAVKLKNS